MAVRRKKLPVIDPEDWLREIAIYLSDPSNRKKEGKVEIVKLSAITVDAIVEKLKMGYEKYEKGKGD